MNKVVDIATAVSCVKSGDTLLVGGFTNFGCPLSLIYELAKHPEVKDLTTVSEDFGYGDLPYAQAQGALLANGMVKEAVVSFVGDHPQLNAAIKNGEVKLTLVPQGTLAERLRAAGAGLGGFLTPTGVGTVVEEGKETQIFEGKKYLLERPLKGNVAFVHAAVADRMGNAVFHLSANNFNAVMATAADIVVLEAEKIVEPGEIEPDRVQLPGIFVDYIVEAKEVNF